MATRIKALENLFARIFLRDELSSIGKFHHGKSLSKHLNAVKNKIKELEIQEDQHAAILLRTLDEDVVLEIKSCHDYVEEFDFIVNALEQFHGEKASSIGLCSSLLKVKQKPGQSLRDFVSEIRITTMKLFPDVSAEEREKILIMSFIEGIRNANHAVIVRQNEPATLKDAYDLLKNEVDVDQTPDLMKINTEEQDQISKLTKNLEFALQKIRELEDKISKLSTKTSTARFNHNSNLQTPLRTNNTRIICHLCRKPGHIKRNCRLQSMCQICFKSNHQTNDCYYKNMKPKNVRNVDNDSVKSASPSEIEEKGFPMATIQENEENDDTYDDVYVFNNQKNNIQQSPRKKKEYPKDVINWANYVCGNGAKPRRPLENGRCAVVRDQQKQKGSRYAPTLISESKEERARNKPVVPALIEGKIQKNIFFDSGCECNLIDYTFLKLISKANPNVKLLQSLGGTLSCANGSKMEVLGHTMLNVRVGNKSMYMKFAVVTSIFPNMLIGIRSMKAEKICIVPAWDCLKVEGYTVPFVSKIDPTDSNLN